MKNFYDFCYYIQNATISELRTDLFDIFNNLNSIEANEWTQKYKSKFGHTPKGKIVAIEYDNYDKVSSLF